MAFGLGFFGSLMVGGMVLFIIVLFVMTVGPAVMRRLEHNDGFIGYNAERVAGWAQGLRDGNSHPDDTSRTGRVRAGKRQPDGEEYTLVRRIKD